MKKIEDYIRLLRPFTLIYPMVAVLSGSIIAAGGFPSFTVLLAMLSAGILNGASNTINQCCDIPIDRVNKPYRPIPSGRISKDSAFIYGVMLYLFSLVLAWLVNFQFFSIALIAAFFTLIYSIPPFKTKYHGILGNITLMIPRGILPIVAGWSVVRSVFVIEPWVFGIVLGLFVIGANTSKDFSDIKGDRLYGAMTLPVKYGVENAAKMMIPSLIIPFLLIPLFVYVGLLIPAMIPLTLFSLWGIYVSWLLLKNPNKLTLERNHPSWVHMYLMLIVFVIGSALVYSL
jgi:4-hydroxybenzoate polyprenyltransferase